MSAQNAFIDAFSRNDPAVVHGEVSVALSGDHLAVVVSKDEQDVRTLILTTEEACLLVTALHDQRIAPILAQVANAAIVKSIYANLGHVIPAPEIAMWLKRPNKLLQDKTPKELIDSGKGRIVLDLVDDMLTGAPT